MNIGYVLIVLVIVVGSVILHELSHGIVAYWLGDNTAKDAGRLSFNPIKHIDPFLSILLPVVLYLLHAPVFGAAKPVPINNHNLKWKEWGMALVAFAGPFTNFLLAFIAFLIGHLSGALYGAGGDTVSFIFTEMVFVNLGFMVFNLIPVPPLDGSRILFAISPDPFRKFLASIEQYGLALVFLLVFLLGDLMSHVMISVTQGILNFFYWIVGM